MAFVRGLDPRMTLSSLRLWCRQSRSFASLSDGSAVPRPSSRPRNLPRMVSARRSTLALRLSERHVNKTPEPFHCYDAGQQNVAKAAKLSSSWYTLHLYRSVLFLNAAISTVCMMPPAIQLAFPTTETMTNKAVPRPYFENDVSPAQTTIPTRLPNPSLQVTADHNLKLVEAPVQAPQKGEVLIHVKATGVCGYVGLVVLSWEGRG
jgi:hypothetical protein